jgi:hypothetical protein
MISAVALDLSSIPVIAARGFIMIIPRACAGYAEIQAAEMVALAMLLCDHFVLA